MALDPLKRSRQRQGPSLAFHTIGVQGYFSSVQPPLSEIPGSAPADNRKKRAVLLSSCGAKTYRLIRNLVAPGKPTDKSFAELVNIVKNHLNPRPLSIVYRFKFNCHFKERQSSNTLLNRKSFRAL